MSVHRSLTVLVTGGSGFIGAAVVAALVRRGHHVVATTTTFSERPLTVDNLHWVPWDVREEPLPHVDWRSLQVILHLAVPRKVSDFPGQACLLYELGIATTFRLLEIARQQGLQRVLVASTGDVLGSSAGPALESDILYMPSSFYGTVKACAELLLRSYHSILSIGILRFYHPYGPGGDRFLINRLVRLVAEGQEIRLEGQDGILLNPVWIEDLALGVCLAIESDQAGTFHFAGPDTVTLRKLVEIIGTLVHRKPNIRVEPTERIDRHVGGFEVTHRTLGYNPQVSVQDGLRRLLNVVPYIRSNSLGKRDND